MSYIDDLRNIKLYGKPAKEKKNYRIRPKSEKRMAQEAADKILQMPDEDSMKEKWFKEIRPMLTGTCQCGCGGASQKNDGMYFRHSICHVFPKAKFHSVKYHPINFVERRFWGGCHSVMDDTSMDRWPQMADWDDIKEKFFVLAPLLTDEERATKFYKHLEKLVYLN